MDDEEKSDAAGKRERMAEELAQGAGRMGRSLAKVIEALAGLPGQDVVRKKLAEMSREFETQRMRAMDIASGADDRRRRPMVDALAAALAGGEEEWVEAMARLAQCALEEDRPAWYAGAMLSSLRVDPGDLSARAAKALAGPIGIERSLGTPGYRWDWVEGHPEGQAAWVALTKRAGLAW